MVSTTPFFGYNNLNRPYDSYMSVPALQKALQLRGCPDGKVQPVVNQDRRGKTIAVYPWKKMELGDMFFAPIGDKSTKSMSIGFHKAAARYDLEICIVRVSHPYSGVDCLRVSVSAVAISVAKLAAYKDGAIKFPPAVGKHKEEKEAKERKQRLEKVKQRRAGVKPKPAKLAPNSPPSVQKLKSQRDAEREIEANEKAMYKQGYRPNMTTEEKRDFALRKRR